MDLARQIAAPASRRRRLVTGRAYAFEPVPDDLTAAQAANVLGVQANNMGPATRRSAASAARDQYAFPKLAALAEVA